MRFLLDTNVISALRRARHHPQVVAWYAGLPPDDLYLSAISLGEIAKGIEKQRRSNPDYAKTLNAWLESLLADHADRILPVDTGTAIRWGRLCHTHPQAATDMLLAATAIEHDMVLVTRNLKDFGGTGARLLDPFDSRSQGDAS